MITLYELNYSQRYDWYIPRFTWYSTCMKLLLFTLLIILIIYVYAALTLRMGYRRLL